MSHATMEQKNIVFAIIGIPFKNGVRGKSYTAGHVTTKELATQCCTFKWRDEDDPDVIWTFGMKEVEMSKLTDAEKQNLDWIPSYFPEKIKRLGKKR